MQKIIFVLKIPVERGPGDHGDPAEISEGDLLKSTDSLRQFLEYLIAQVDENITLYRRIYQTNKNGSLMFTIQGDLAKILTESGWQGENQGVRLKIPLPLYVSFMSSFYLTTLRSYLELADEYDAKTFVESVCRFALRDFWEKADG